MIRICGKLTCKPLQLILNHCIDTASFPVESKKFNLVPVHKRGDTQCLKNYRPVSLLSICREIFEKLTFNGMLKFLIENNLISLTQSGF